jgi:hypothetical protein
MKVVNLRLSFTPKRLSVRVILPYGLTSDPTVITTFSEFFASFITKLAKFNGDWQQNQITK